MNTKLVAIVALAAIALVALAPNAAAHKTVYSADGKIKIVWGFTDEPAVTMNKMGLDLILSDNATGAPVTGAQETLTAALKHGDDTLAFDDFRAAFGRPGSYTATVTLTQPGIYVLDLAGTINGSAVDMEIPSAHEVEPIEETYFPELTVAPSGGDTSALEARLAALEAKVAALQAQQQTQSSVPATVTSQPTAAGTVPVPMAGAVLVLLAVGSIALALRRRD